MFTFKSCCFCLSLRTGSFLIAVSEILILLMLNAATKWWTNPIGIIGNIVAVTFVGLLFYASVKENRTYLRWWLIINSSIAAILAAVVAFCAMGCVVVLAATGSSNASRVGQYWAVYMFIYVALVAFGISAIRAIFSLVVYSYICELREREDSKHEIGRNIARPEMHNLVPV